MTETTLPARRAALIGDQQLADIHSWDDLGRLINANNVTLESLADYGSGVIVASDKDKLLGVPFVIVSYAFHEGDMGPFVSATIVTKNPVVIDGSDASKLVVNDGSTGILSQLLAIEAKRVERGVDLNPIYCRGGLRKSVYDYTDEKGKVSKATTYYLA